MISSAGCGMMGSLPPQPLSSAATTTDEITAVLTLSCCARAAGLVSEVVEDEREHQAQQREELGQGEAGERDGLQHAPRLGLARHPVDVRGEDETHADTGADGGETVGQEGDVASHSGCPFGYGEL